MSLPSFPPKIEEWLPGEAFKEPPLPKFALNPGQEVFKALPPSALLWILAGVMSLAAALAGYRETKGEV